MKKTCITHKDKPASFRIEDTPRGFVPVCRACADRAIKIAFDTAEHFARARIPIVKNLTP